MAKARTEMSLYNCQTKEWRKIRMVSGGFIF